MITADQPVGAYWIQLRGLGECGIRRAQQLAILRYARGPYQPASPAPTYDVGIPQGVVSNLGRSDRQCTLKVPLWVVSHCVQCIDLCSSHLCTYITSFFLVVDQSIYRYGSRILKTFFWFLDTISISFGILHKIFSKFCIHNISNYNSVLPSKNVK